MLVTPGGTMKICSAPVEPNVHWTCPSLDVHVPSACTTAG
jgi:hypothetical protein